MKRFFPNGTTRPAFVVDLTVAAAWVLFSRSTSYTRLTLTRLSQVTAAVPVGFPSDIAQEWLDGEATGELAPGEADQRLSQLRNFRLRLDIGWSAAVWSATVPLARRLGLPVGRAAYVELAARLNLPLATIDPALVAAAPAAGVTLVP